MKAWIDKFELNPSVTLSCIVKRQCAALYSFRNVEGSKSENHNNKKEKSKK